jgi:DNA-binding transcriptional LysR family regulator
MAKALDWDSRIGRRVRLRDLHILFAVIQHGSMAKAGVHLGMSQSAVSQAIAAIEHALRVRLLDRTSSGVTPTIYANALLRRGRAAFDELRLGVQEIEDLADPATGEVRISSTETIAAGILPPVIERLSQRYPRIKLHVAETAGLEQMEFSELRERRADVRLTILVKPLEGELAKEFEAEILRRERICLATGAPSPWSRRRSIDLAELVDEPWILPLPTPGGAAVLEAFRARGLPPPRITVTTTSVHLRTFLATSGRFIVALPASVLNLYADLFGLKQLPVDLPLANMPSAMIRLRNRTLSPAAELFMQCTREVTKSMDTTPKPLSRRHSARHPAKRG